MLSSYRLGDLVMLSLKESEKNAILTEHPNSFASKYILESKKQNNEYCNIELITKIVVEYIEQNIHILPKDIEDSTVIHLRLGDVVAGIHGYEQVKRPLKIEYLKSLVINDTNKKYIIGKCFFGEVSSTNYEECQYFSNIYLQNAINELEAEHFNSGDADIDLCCAVKSKKFIQGRGWFSQLILEIRKQLNIHNNIETAPEAWPF